MVNDKALLQTVNTLFKGMEGFLSAKSIVGEPIHIGDTIILPLMDVQFGVGAGAFTTDKKNNGGGGMSGKMTPTAVLIIQDGETKVVNIGGGDGGISKLVDMVPGIVNKFFKKPKEQEADEAVQEKVDEVVSDIEAEGSTN